MTARPPPSMKPREILYFVAVIALIILASIILPGCQTGGMGIVAQATPSKSWRVPATAPTTQAVSPTQSYKPSSGTVLDFGGALIDARGIPKVAYNGAPISVLFNVAFVSDVTIRNARIVADGQTIIVQANNAKRLTVENVRLYSPQDNADQCFNGVLINGSSGVTITNLVADITNKYLVYCDTSDNVILNGVKLTVGSRNETAVRFMYGFANVQILNCDLRAEPDLCPSKQMALRVHASGHNVQILNCKFHGGVTLGHMTGGDGGQYEKDPVKRKAILGYRLQDVIMRNCAIDGWIDMEPGLERATIANCNIKGRVSAVNVGGNPGQKITWGYPDAKALQPGDVPIPAPACTFIETKFSSAMGVSKYLFMGGTNGPKSFKFMSCEYDGKPVK